MCRGDPINTWSPSPVQIMCRRTSHLVRSNSIASFLTKDAVTVLDQQNGHGFERHQEGLIQPVIASHHQAAGKGEEAASREPEARDSASSSRSGTVLNGLGNRAVFTKPSWQKGKPAGESVWSLSPEVLACLSSALRLCSGRPSEGGALSTLRRQWPAAGGVYCLQNLPAMRGNGCQQRVSGVCDQPVSTASTLIATRSRPAGRRPTQALEATET